MYTEEFEGLEEKAAENEPRAYVSSVSHQDAGKLQRENEKLKKSLEKERFFNKLLDQELKDLKTEINQRLPADYTPPSRGVSKGLFFTVLILMLGMAGYIIYQYNDNESNFFNSNPDAVVPAPGVTTNEPANSSPADEQPTATDNEAITREPVADNNPPATPVVKDSVPNIIGKADTKKVTEKPKAAQEQKQNQATVQSKPAQKNEEASLAPTVAETTPPPVTETPPAQQPAREPIAKYRVTSKANFYTAPDENALGRAFINGGNKEVNAYEDKNGFIYVEYVNERGMMNKGWLSKKDLTKE